MTMPEILFGRLITKLITLEDHFTHIGGNLSTTRALNTLYSVLLQHVDAIEEHALRPGPGISLITILLTSPADLPTDYGGNDRQGLSDSLKKYRELVKSFHKSLYDRRHAFLFREVKKWEEHLKVFRISYFRHLVVHCTQ